MQLIAALNPVLRGGETTFGGEMPNESSISWIVTFTGGWLSGWRGMVGSDLSGLKSGPMNVSQVWVCTG